MGGKSRYANRIIALFPNDHRCYVEVFGGSGAVLFSLPPEIRVRSEVYNDLNGDLANFFRVARGDYRSLIERLRLHLASREDFEFYLQQDVRDLDAVGRAARFFYLIKNGFGGKREHFGYARTQPPGFHPERLPQVIAETHARLISVFIEQQSFGELIRRYDSKDTLFYCDPPYIGLTGYELPFEMDDHYALKESLQAIQGRFLLSLNDCEEARDMYRNFHFETIETVYTVAATHSKKARELLISNYEIIT